MTVLAVSAAVLCASAVLTGVMRRVALRRGLLDTPVERSLHVVPMPRLGGVAILLAATGGWALLIALDPAAGPSVRGLAIGGLVIGLAGFIDDLRDLQPVAKFGGQVGAAILALGLLPEGYRPPWPAGIAAGTLLLVTYVNFFNFMDGADGLAAGVAVIASAALAAIGYQTGVNALAAGGAIAAAAALGFLFHNYPPATIFMGDAGSQFLGLTLGVLGVAGWQGGVPLPAILAVLAPFLFDASLTLARRICNGERVWRAHKTHLYQRLIGKGWTHASVACLYYAWSAYGAVLALAAGGTAWVALAGLAPGLIIVWLAKDRAES